MVSMYAQIQYQVVLGATYNAQDSFLALLELTRFANMMGSNTPQSNPSLFPHLALSIKHE